IELLYVGTERGMERELVPKAGLPFETIHVQGLPRRLGWRQIQALWRAWRSAGEAKRILRRFRPDVVVGTGGYVCGPVVFAAHRMGIPTMIHEQNVVPGLTNRLLARWVDVVAVSFPNTEPFSGAKRVVITGNPRASELVGVDSGRVEALRIEYGLARDKRTVVIFSGSRGAPPINRAATGLCSKFAGQVPFQLVWITGKNHYDTVRQELEQRFESLPPGITVIPFCDDMPALLHLADCVVSRAGASTVAELTAAGTPAILIPSPYVVGRHQERNAQWLAQRGAATVLAERDLSPERLYREIVHILDANVTGAMASRSRELGLTDAAQTLTMLVCSLASGRRGR
ncbi:MAG: undecaprenyldiphospho-muramoylpentapeptide beta-N-acetylglucosaminyltransferase, partial [Alicyclobacillaceae bacterium]|nr:undecaprenyldiphospho-muramoylpentapeptide beta-N-acetylglucosaminyltransferase [Alicyclobacillaceae bacterium]